jgi:hypothetical protein
MTNKCQHTTYVCVHILLLIIWNILIGALSLNDSVGTKYIYDLCIDIWTHVPIYFLHVLSSVL